MMVLPFSWPSPWCAASCLELLGLLGQQELTRGLVMSGLEERWRKRISRRRKGRVYLKVYRVVQLEVTGLVFIEGEEETIITVILIVYSPKAYFLEVDS